MTTNDALDARMQPIILAIRDELSRSATDATRIAAACDALLDDTHDDPTYHLNRTELIDCLAMTDAELIITLTTSMLMIMNDDAS